MSTTEVHVVEPKVEIEKPTSPNAAPRKRRRRPPATGAADDCFACQERQSKCDRRRPYCTQCLDMGKDCSGYKTTLTWGVGVASRGKLRGLSLPIASSKRAAQSTEEDDAKLTHGPRKHSKLVPTRSTSDAKGIDQRRTSSSTSSASHYSPSPTTFDFVNMDPNLPTSASPPMLPPPSHDWRVPSSMSQARHARFMQRPSRRHSLQPIQKPQMHPTRDYGVMPMTASVVGGYGHNDFGFSPQVSSTMPTFTGYGLLSPTYTPRPVMSSTSEGNYFSGSDPFDWQTESSGSVSSDTNSLDFCDGLNPFFTDIGILPSQQTFTSAPDTSAFMTDTKFSFTDQSTDLVSDDVGEHSSLAIPRPLHSLSIGNTPKLQYLIDYYDKVISPVIVAFDGPTNPYRSHILSLAVESETLQHAIAALAASNIRMRREHNPQSMNRRSNSGSLHDQSVRKSSLAHSFMDMGMDRLPQTSSGEPSQDELFHKSTSIRTLNEQLADPNRRKDDSVLATLLILCLYHICDTGVAKFKTQFAGVKKILALRGGSTGENSKACNWLTIMFTWFDAMTATVNDREGQLNSDDISGMSSDEWALENLAGCDARLFKVIAKLGRLNLLSQGKPVSDSHSLSNISPTLQAPGLAGLNQDYYSMSAPINANARFDGNGWSSIPQSPPPCNGTDTRYQFWREWREIRNKLNDWSINTTTSSPMGSKERDIFHISESFRYSALLYTERLAYPHLPSAHAQFSGLVTEALFHIANVKSDVFLLWPLFITGTECVSEQGRYLIRERCHDIQKDSGFFNNISGLELLEKVWREDEEGCVGGAALPVAGLGPNEWSSVGGQGFKWRRAMERVDGEFIVV